MNNNYCILQGMTRTEREELKSFATQCGNAGDIQSLERTLIMIAHWMRQGKEFHLLNMPASGQRHSANGATVITQHPKWRSNGLSVVKAVSVPVVQIITLLVWEMSHVVTRLKSATQ